MSLPYVEIEYPAFSSILEYTKSGVFYTTLANIKQGQDLYSSASRGISVAALSRNKYTFKVGISHPTVSYKKS